MGFVIEEVEIDEEKTRGTGLPIQFNGNKEDFIYKAEEIAREQIGRFFEGKSYFIGGPIPYTLLYSRQSLNTVLSYSFCEGIDLIHEIIGQGPDLEDQVEWSTYQILTILHETHRRRIYNGLRVGIMLLYLKFCKGKKLPQIDLDITHLIS